MSNVNNDFPQLPIYPDERFHHSDQEVRGTQQYLSHLFSGLPVKVAPDPEPRCISSESDADSNAESIVKKVLDVVFDEDYNAGSVENGSVTPNLSKLDPHAQVFIPRINRLTPFEQHIERMNEIAFCLTEHWGRDLSEIELQFVQSFPEILSGTFTLLENDGLSLDQETLGVKNRLEKAKAIVNGVLGDLDTHDQKRSVRTKFSNILPVYCHGRERLALGLLLGGIIKNLQQLQ